jgi:DNA mismatch endonuclease Vsr
MAAIRSKDTTPELAVRRFLHREGYRFNVGRRIAGYRPDIVFTRRRKAVFVHGCFWHSHACGTRGGLPRTRSEYWQAKLAGNQRRDERASGALTAAGWEVLTVWECEARREAFGASLKAFLGPACWPRRSSGLRKRSFGPYWFE